MVAAFEKILKEKKNMIELILKDDKGDWFDLIQYPDGQKSICLKLDKLNKKEIYTIKCRIKNFSELEVLLCCLEALNRNDIIIIRVEFSYLVGIRSDRAFNQGEPNYFKDVITNVLNLYDIEYRIQWLFAPLALKYSYYGNRNICLVCDIIEDQYVQREWYQYIKIGGDKSVNIYSLGLQGNFDKNRGNNSIEVKLDKELIDKITEDNDKKITQSSYLKELFPNSYEEKIYSNLSKILIIDDLCDGGATFIAEAKYLKSLFPHNKLKLFVYHGLFTKGLDELLEYFEEIICTNSYQDIDHPRVRQIKVI